MLKPELTRNKAVQPKAPEPPAREAPVGQVWQGTCPVCMFSGPMKWTATGVMFIEGCPCRAKKAP